jgi:superfamily II DNA helicase RecQ
MQASGVMVIVTPNHSYLKEKLWRVNNKVSWVAINNKVSQQQREKILSHLESGGFKLIFIHPELLHTVTITGVSLLVFDEA